MNANVPKTSATQKTTLRAETDTASLKDGGATETQTVQMPLMKWYVKQNKFKENVQKIGQFREYIAK